MFRKKFKGTPHVLGSGENAEGGGPAVSLLDKLEKAKEKKPKANVSLTEHLQQLDAERRNAPLQFCQDVSKSDDAASEFETQIAVLLSNGENSVAAVALMRRILRNLVLSPNDKKFQRLSLTNAKVQDGLVAVPGAVEFVCLCGFERKEQQLLYEGDPSMELPRKGLQHLAERFPEPRAEAPRAISPPPPEVPQRERRTRVLLMKPTEATVPEWFFERTSAELKAEYFAMVQRREQDQRFMTREQRAQLNGDRRQYSYAVLRVRLPEGVLLEGEFDGKESMVRIHEWISAQLRDAGRPFELFLPSRERLGLKGTVVECQLMPATLLSFHWTDGLGMTTAEPTVRDELLVDAALDWEEN